MTAPAHPTTLVICNGGLPAVVGAAIEAERGAAGSGGGAFLMPWTTDAVAAVEQATASASLARFLRLEVAEPCLPAPGPTLPDGLSDSLCLLVAMHTARLAGCSRVVWPVQFHSDDASIGGDLERIAAAVDRAQLIGRLSLLEGEAAGHVTIETPLADLTDAQVADLAVDLDAPVYLAWWWRTLADRRAEAAAGAERRAWLPVLRDAGWVESAPTPTVASRAAQPETTA